MYKRAIVPGLARAFDESRYREWRGETVDYAHA